MGFEIKRLNRNTEICLYRNIMKFKSMLHDFDYYNLQIKPYRNQFYSHLMYLVLLLVVLGGEQIYFVLYFDKKYSLFNFMNIKPLPYGLWKKVELLSSLKAWGHTLCCLINVPPPLINFRKFFPPPGPLDPPAY